MAGKVFVTSLGCPKNLTDTEKMSALSVKRGFEISFDEESSDHALLNTCGFIGPAIEESHEHIKYLLQLKAEGVFDKVVVAGCLANRCGEALLRNYPDLDGVVGIGDQDKIAEVFDSSERSFLCKYQKNLVLEPKLQVTLPHTAYLKIADGCDNKCTYCTIPLIRGGYRSKPKNDIITEAQFLAEQGVKELTLIAQDTTRYGIDLYGSCELPDLLRHLVKIDGIEWIRVMYAYPELVSDELIELMAQEHKVCNYLDMPLQHIADNVLSRMNRRLDSAGIRKLLKKIRSKVPDVAIRTNFIVGFPGETADDFEILKRFVKEEGFSRVGVFTYYPETGTAAAELENQISEELKEIRCDELINEQSRVIDKMNKGLIGKNFRILMDTPNVGRTFRDAPEIDGFVELKNSSVSAGSFANVQISGASGYQLEGILIQT